MAKILITGATGFLGKFIVDEMLAQGHSLRLLVRDIEGRDLKRFEKAEIYEGDILVEHYFNNDGVLDSTNDNGTIIYYKYEYYK